MKDPHNIKGTVAEQVQNLVKRNIPPVIEALCAPEVVSVEILTVDKLSTQFRVKTQTGGTRYFLVKVSEPI